MVRKSDIKSKMEGWIQLFASMETERQYDFRARDAVRMIAVVKHKQYSQILTQSVVVGLRMFMNDIEALRRQHADNLDRSDRDSLEDQD